jgi:hypothetical protein
LPFSFLLDCIMDNSGFLTFYEPTRQGEAARDPQMLHQPVSGSKPWFGSGCGNSWAVKDVVGNPGLVPRGNFGNSPEGGCAIDLQSQLLWGDSGTVRMKGPQQLFARPYATTPYLGGGSVKDVVGNPGLVPRGNFGNSPEGGCAIDLQSQLLWGDSGTVRMKGPQQLFARPYATTPYLGGGSIENIPDQSKVMYGHSTANRKSIQTVTDKQFPVFEPLIAERAADIPEHNYFVEPFLRGGQASRLIPRIRVDTTK